MPEFHAEPYVYLPSVSHKSALIAWGAFYFRTNTRGKWKIVDDEDLKYVHPPRKDSIGAKSAPYGPARVEVYDATGSGRGSFENGGCKPLLGLGSDAEHRVHLQSVRERRRVGRRRALGLVGEGQSARAVRQPLRPSIRHQSRSRCARVVTQLCGDRRLRCGRQEGLRDHPSAERRRRDGRRSAERKMFG